MTSRPYAYLHHFKPALLLSVFLLGAGCSPSGGPAKGYPKPGEMRLVKMELQEEKIDDSNLIRNGDFKQWWAGAPVPNGFSQPSESFATVRAIEGGDISGIIQQWLKIEEEKELPDMLRTESAPLEAGKSYTLEITAASNPVRLVSIDLWTRQEGSWIPVESNFLTLQPQTVGLKTYRKSFVAKSSAPITVAASSFGAITEDPVGWLEWRLTAGGLPAS